MGKNNKLQGGESSGKVVIVGPANVGKSVIFNKFSKSYSIVSNYSQTTYEAVRKEADFLGKRYEVIDTPGIFSLNVLSNDERVTRDLLIDEKPELIIFCGDATNLKNSLILLPQLLELGIPTVFTINKLDDAEKKGLKVDSLVLTSALGMRVVEDAAVYGVGLKSLETAAISAKPHDPCLKYPAFIEDALSKLMALFSEVNRPSKGELLLLLSGHEALGTGFKSKYGSQAFNEAVELLKGLHRQASPLSIRSQIFKARENWASNLYENVSYKEGLKPVEMGERIAELSRHPFFGWAILLGVIWVTFYGVGTIATAISTALDLYILTPITDAVSYALPYPFLNEFLVGDFGILTMGVANAIGTVIPILLVFFLIVNFLEDVGYLPNLGVLLNRALTPFGLSGKSVLPMVLGFGCNTMATLATRMLDTPRERFIASFLIALGFPCAVQLGVMFAILAVAPFSALLIVIVSVSATQILVGVALNRFMPSARKPDFIIELPTFKWPHWRNTVKKTYYRIKWFLLEAVPMFIYAAFFMFVLEKTGLLQILRAVLKPVVSGFLSLPEKVAEVFILVLSRREVGAVYFKDMFDAGEVDYYQTVVGLVVITLFVPCLSNTMVMIKELGFNKAIAVNIFVVVAAILIGGLVNFIIRFF